MKSKIISEIKKDTKGAELFDVLIEFEIGEDKTKITEYDIQVFLSKQYGMRKCLSSITPNVYRILRY